MFPDVEGPLRGLAECTHIGVLHEIFINTVTISETNKYGHTLTMLEAVASTYELNMCRETFWGFFSYMLNRLNESIRLKIEAKRRLANAK